MEVTLVFLVLSLHLLDEMFPLLIVLFLSERLGLLFEKSVLQILVFVLVLLVAAEHEELPVAGLAGAALRWIVGSRD